VVNTSGEIRLKDLIPTHPQFEYDTIRVSCLSIGLLILTYLAQRHY